MMATRWGIAGAGLISNDFAKAMATVPTGEHIIIAVVDSYDFSLGEDFAKRNNVQKVYQTYEDLANDADVEVVYIGALNPQHLEIAKLMLNHGKHVLCEKTMTKTLKQTTELTNLAKEKGLFLMEAIWSRSFPIYDWIKEEIKFGSLGEIKQVIAYLGVPFAGSEGFRKKQLQGGTILNFGVYAIQFASFVFNGEKPMSVSAVGHLDAEGIDNAISASLLYKDGPIATFVTHALVTLPNEAFIIGTKGTIRIRNFWCPTQFTKPSGETQYLPLPESEVPYNYINSAALRFEAAEVRKCLQAGLKESPRVPHRDSLLIAEIQQEIRRQIGIVYAED